MSAATLTEKGQIVIPNDIRARYELNILRRTESDISGSRVCSSACASRRSAARSAPRGLRDCQK
jgi:bifunctional DNA-binding transcriptional regulator/antitoxin component of YhaV-PrlF toxin-antitoxin module